jgi:CheY-like chemotaxis protein
MMIAPHATLRPVSIRFAAGSAPQDDAPEQGNDQRNRQTRSLRVLIVEDEFFISLHTTTLVEALGHAVVGVAVSADAAIRLAEKEGPDVVLMDIRLAGARSGIDAAREIRERFGIGSIFVTANSDVQTRQSAEAVQPLGFLVKPLDELRLRQCLNTLASS